MDDASSKQHFGLHQDLKFIYLLVRRLVDIVGVRKRHGLTSLNSALFGLPPGLHIPGSGAGIPKTILHREIRGAIETRRLCITNLFGTQSSAVRPFSWVMCSFKENQWRRTCGLQRFSTPAAVRHTPTLF